MVETLTIPIVFIILASILFWFIIGAKGHWFLKFVAIAFTISFSLIFWESLDGYFGFPYKGELPSKYFVHYAVVDEPAQDNEGAIYVWLSDFENIKNKPRVYQLPYSKQLHSEVSEMIKGIKSGNSYIGTNGKKKGNAKKGKEGKEGKGGGYYKYSVEQKAPLFYKLPPPTYPDKPTS